MLMSFITIGAIQKESLRFEVHISCVNTAFSQIPCTYLPECFDKIRFLESVLNRCPRLRLAFKNIYGNVGLSRIINSSCELFKATRCIRLVLYSCEKVRYLYYLHDNVNKTSFAGIQRHFQDRML